MRHSLVFIKLFVTLGVILPPKPKQGHSYSVQSSPFPAPTLPRRVAFPLQLFSSSYDRTVKMWSLDDRAYIDTLFGHQVRVGIEIGRGVL